MVAFLDLVGNRENFCLTGPKNVVGDPFTTLKSLGLLRNTRKALRQIPVSGTEIIRFEDTKASYEKKNSHCNRRNYSPKKTTKTKAIGLKVSLNR